MADTHGKKHNRKKIRAHVEKLQREARAEKLKSKVKRGDIDRARAMILTRDLRKRLYTLCYFVRPDKTIDDGTPTKAQAVAAADGILVVATQIEELLGVNRG